MASLLMSIYMGLRLGRLMFEQFDVSGAVRTLFMMHAGRLQPSKPNLGITS